MMQLLMEDGSGHTKEPYVQMILEEPDFHSDGTRVVYDALHWALQHGIYTILLLRQSFLRVVLVWANQRAVVPLYISFYVSSLCVGRYDSRVRVILHSWATQLFGLTVEHFEMLEDAIVVRVKSAAGCAKTPQ